MKISGKIKIWKIWIGATFWGMKEGVETDGIYDLCEDGLRVVFCDYDMMRLKEEWMTKQLRAIQEEFKLSDFLVFKSSDKGFHAICFDKCSSKEVNDIITRTSCDSAFKHNWTYDWVPRVLRTGPKGGTPAPVFLYTLESKYNRRKKSLAHIKYYENMFGIEINNKTNNDGDKRYGVYPIRYHTKKNVR
jgi:hypothetical protein